MADKKISQLTEKETLVGTDVLTILDSEDNLANKKILASLVIDSYTGTSPIDITDKVVSIATADTSTTGALTSTDWNTFNGKQDAVTTTAPIDITNNVISIPQATDDTDGYLISDDWNTFNEKEDVQFVTADVSSTTATLTLEANTCYTFATALTALTLSNYINSTKEIEIHFTTANTFTFTASGWLGKWCGGVPTFEASTGYVIAIKNGLGVIGKVGA